MSIIYNLNQIKALLKKDLLIRLRQPWMTIIQVIWPCLIFSSLYLLRHRFEATKIADCQFPTRQLPTHHNLLPFFHSYICTIENKCSNVTNYQEYTTFEEAPIKPILNIISYFLNNDELYQALVDLPENGNWIAAVTTIALHPKFSGIQENIGKIITSVPEVEKMINGSFDITKMFSDDLTFQKSGKIICGHPFPSNNNIRFVNNILDSKDYSDVNQDELDAMPTKYCKKLYLDISRSNRGKITWSQVKPIIQGKIIYGPEHMDITSIMKFANGTFEEMNRLKTLATAVNQTIYQLHQSEKFLKSYMSLLDLAKSPFVKSLIGDSVNIEQIELIMNRIKNDPHIASIIQTVNNILECFSVDRFIAVKNETELNQMAFQLNQKRLFYGGVYFNNNTNNDQHITYKLHVDTENTPITIENHNRFWFPGPEASMVENLRYHRGFVQIKQSIDFGIIKFSKHKQMELERISAAAAAAVAAFTNTTPATSSKSNDQDSGEDDEEFDNWFNDWQHTKDDEDVNNSTSTSTEKPSNPTLNPIDYTKLLNNLIGGAGIHNNNSNSTSQILNSTFNDNDNDWDEDLNLSTTPKSVRQKRSPQLGDLFSSLFNKPSASKSKQNDKFLIDDVQIYTKQFPYAAYIKDDFKRGLYLAQSLQMAFFMALLIQIASCVRYRIWMKESKNTMLMNAMGLKSSSEILAWMITTFLEILIVFIIACCILYIGQILYYTSFIFVLIFLIIFGLCMISFCFMCSTIFSSASIGSVSSSIFFLISFLPYIVIICLDTQISGVIKFLTNLSFSTAFCYAFDHIMRQELQGIPLTYSHLFKNGFNSEFTYAFCMIILDTILYIIIGNLINYYKNDEYKFHHVERKYFNTNVGAKFENVTKIYDNNHQSAAVNNINIEFQRNQITCLLGRNGAGKSTIIKMLTGQILPTKGEIYLAETLTSNTQNPTQNLNIDQIGFCPQDNILIPNLTAKEHLELYAKIKCQMNFDTEIMKTMKSLNLGQYENYQVNQLSGGYQRKLCVAIAFIGSPNIVILDEPCSSIDTNSRQYIWQLVEDLRQGRTVILATHFLEEAEYFSDCIMILNEGKICYELNPKSLEELFTKSLNLIIIQNQKNQFYDIKILIQKYLNKYHISYVNDNQMNISIDYDSNTNHCSELLNELEILQTHQQIQFTIQTQTLENVFVNLENSQFQITTQQQQQQQQQEQPQQQRQSQSEKFNLYNEKDEIHNQYFYMKQIRQLFWKRFLHLKRNYKLLLCILGLPLLFQIIAMSFMQLRPGGEYDKQLNLTRQLYTNTTEFYSIENANQYTNQIITNYLHSYCEFVDNSKYCIEKNNSKEIFYWLLDTQNSYQMTRYGGITMNNSLINIWYNNKGYHSMVSWQNELNTNLLQTEMNDTNYQITTINQPIKLGQHELSTSSILQQVSDAGISLILLIAFSLVAAGASVFIVNERVSGEKLQQKLCGVNFQTYWTVAFIWDFVIYLISLMMCVIVFQVFDIPIFVAKSNLNGICLLVTLYGFTAIAMVHLIEKLFQESSFANMTIFCMNVVIALATLTTIVLFDVIGESDASVQWRNLLNRIFLIFPQHALADGLIEICKNYITSEVFKRLDIDTYRSPVSTSLLLPQYLALICMGILFIILNYLIENELYIEIYESIRNCWQYHQQKIHKTVELNIISIQNSLLKNHNISTLNQQQTTNITNSTLYVKNLQKSYQKNEYTVKDATFMIQAGQCYGLIGKNGAGKSTIFQILTGQLRPDSGTYTFQNKNIAYCPQTIALDQLLTVEEILKFYGHLRRIKNIDLMIENTLNTFNLEKYENIMVKNLSGGNRRKLNVAVSCIGNCNLILMDEPTSDMDPITRSLVYQAINNILLDGRSVLLTSHAITEIDQVCQQIGILKMGKLINCGSPDDLKKHFGGYYCVTIYSKKNHHQHQQQQQQHHDNNIDLLLQLKQEIENHFPYAKNIQIHSYTMKFIVKIQQEPAISTTILPNTNEKHTHTHSYQTIKLSQLFQQLNQYTIENQYKFSITRCRLEIMYEQIINSNDDDLIANIENHQFQNLLSSTIINNDNLHNGSHQHIINDGIDGRGYYHKSFESD